MLLYLLMINILTFLLMGMDKRRAKKEQYRIPERTFWLLAILGGALGVFIGMKVHRHKTKHRSFAVWIPILIFINVLFFTYIGVFFFA